MFRPLMITAALCGTLFLSVPGIAQDQKVLVTVNDRPITSYDVTARINLWKLLGRDTKGDGIRKKALNNLIDDIARVEEAKKFGADAKEKEIELRLTSVAKGMGTDDKGLRGKLKAQGITLRAMRDYIAAQIAFNRLLAGKYKVTINVTEAEIDRKFASIKAEVKGSVDKQLAKIKSDPRMQPVTVYQVLEVNFPVDLSSPGAESLLQSRFVEASGYTKKFKSCSGARAAASGIFNVKVGKMQEADGRRLPAPMKAAFKRPGTAIGPFRTKDGIQVWGFCGTRKIVPKLPKAEYKYPTRDQIANFLQNQKFEEVEAKYGRELRKSLLIEFRDQAYAD